MLPSAHLGLASINGCVSSLPCEIPVATKLARRTLTGELSIRAFQTDWRAAALLSSSSGATSGSSNGGEIQLRISTAC